MAHKTVIDGELKVRLYTRQFFLLCFSSFLFFMSFNLMVPELNRYVTTLGGEDMKQYNIMLFALAALLSRPWSGRLADAVGRMPVMYMGALICCLMGLMYPLIIGLFGYLTIRFVHGFSTGFMPTGTTAFMADIVPARRRGEAVGMLGMAGSLGMAAGPALGSEIAQIWGFDAMFYASSIVAAISLVSLLGMKETLPNKERISLNHFKLKPADVFDLRVLQPSLVMFFSVACFGMSTYMIPDLSDHLGIRNRGTFFTIYISISVVLRVVSGSMSDRYGRGLIMRIGVLLLVLGMVAIAFAETKEMLYFSAVLFGLANGLNSPTIFAWTIDLAGDKSRARATSSLFIALEAGIIVGIIFAYFIYQNNPANFKPAFLAGAGMAFLSLLILLWQRKEGRKA